MSIESFAAVVGDSDGGAFVTKQEFEELKESFDKQIEIYNNSIDNKIDGAIANYLYGMNLEVWQKMKLDPKSQYRFPLVMCGPNNEWNNPDYKSDTGSHYFDLSVPNCDAYQISTAADRSNSDDGTPDSNVTNAVYTSLPVSVGVQTTAQLNKGNTCRITHQVQTYQYTGRVGTINTLRKTTQTRKISGTNRTLFELVNRGKGQYNIYKRQSTGVGVFWDGQAEGNTNGKWNYMIFVGLDRSNFGPNTTNESDGDQLTWAVATGNKPKTIDWTKSSGMKGFHSCNGNRNFTIDLDGVTNVQAALDIMNAAPTIWYSQKQNSGDFFSNPFLVLPNWEHTDGTNTCYYGTANMQGNVDGGYWKFTPVVGTSAANQKIEKTFTALDWDASRFLVYNFTGSDISSYCGVLPHRPVMIPYWRAADNNSFLEQSSNDFSQLRASVVYYTDSNGDKHYLDEGMYLGTYNRNRAEVTFTVKFKDDSDWSVDLALSKKPFGYDASNSDRVSYTYKDVTTTTTTTGTENTCAAGSTARMQCNRSFKITVKNINIGDKLYMQWQPATAGHYVALESFTDYQITGY